MKWWQTITFDDWLLIAVIVIVVGGLILG